MHFNNPIWVFHLFPGILSDIGCCFFFLFPPPTACCYILTSSFLYLQHDHSVSIFFFLTLRLYFTHFLKILPQLPRTCGIKVKPHSQPLFASPSSRIQSIRDPTHFHSFPLKCISCLDTFGFPSDWLCDTRPCTNLPKLPCLHQPNGEKTADNSFHWGLIEQNVHKASKSFWHVSFQ